MLGATVRHAIEHVEVFPAPAHVSQVRFTTDELTSMCPVTEQPDLSHVVIEYVPDQWCIESKSLKLYLWGFRDRAVFAEALAAEIAGEVMHRATTRGEGHADATPTRRHRSARRQHAPPLIPHPRPVPTPRLRHPRCDACAASQLLCKYREAPRL